ncbi:MAG: hypothetical protein FWC43_12555, partial [Planctomycetaceae bacterium]|nr:hypothetical protein [Planctomycetaceae bacterium]
ATLPIDDRIMDIIGNITWLGGRVADVPPERIVQVITNVIKGKEGVEMAETIQRGIFQQGVAEGVAQGVLAILEVRFNRVPKEVEKAVRSMTDAIALASLLEHAKSCKSLEEFAELLN